MTFINELLENGGNFIVQRSEDGASFRPTSGKDTDMQSFQTVVGRLRDNEGDGYRIFREHVTSDRAEDLVDLVIVTLDKAS